jgi:hypothetical protein
MVMMRTILIILMLLTLSACVTGNQQARALYGRWELDYESEDLGPTKTIMDFKPPSSLTMELIRTQANEIITCTGSFSIHNDLLEIDLTRVGHQSATIEKLTKDMLIINIQNERQEYKRIK